METDLIYDHFTTPVGVKIEAVSGGGGYSEKVATALSRQIWQESGPAGYRVIQHFDNGAPCHSEIEARISVSHSPGLFVVASLPRTPEADLSVFNLRTAMGVDCEPLNRDQVMRIRERFLSPDELERIPDTTEDTLLAWTAKEACFKAAMTPGLPFSSAINIISLPNPKDNSLGKAEINLPDETVTFNLFSQYYSDHLLTIAYSPKCAAFKRNK